jgi:hypothetical protein
VSYNREDNLKKFTKGKSGNPLGAKALPPSLQKIKQMTRHEANAILSKYLRMPVEELKLVIQDMKLPAIEMWIASGVIQGIKQGDFYNLGVMFDRMFGRIKDAPANEPTNNSQVVIMLPPKKIEPPKDIIDAEISECK